MGLFSTLSSSNGTPQTTSSSKIPTVIQLFTSNPIVLDNVSSKVTGFSPMTYQAVQVGSYGDEIQNRHQNPDLGIWNCCVAAAPGKSIKEQPLVDSLLAKVAGDSSSRTFCWTVDLSNTKQVEPTVSLLQSALVRHLIEHPPTDPEGTPERQTSTTSLYQLQVTQFGLASEDDGSKVTSKNINESYKDVKTTLMICAQLPSDSNEVSEEAYKKKQATALLIYHLRKFAAAINASLCFIQPPVATAAQDPATSEETQTEATPQQQAPEDNSTTQHSQQATVTYDTLSQLWRDLAMDQSVWMSEKATEDQPDTAEQEHVHVSTPLYGPGKHQEDLIDTVLLRNANYPGHWDATKDSLWVALPTPSDSSPETSDKVTGDEGWLGQLRGSITADAPKKAPVQDEAQEEKPKEKDAAVSSFFESLLKNP